jgi:hypothetical protein
MKQIILRMLVAMSLLAAIPSCKKSESPTTPDPPATNKITLGTTVDAGSTSISSSGGTVAIVKPGSPIDGMSILVPPNSFSANRTFAISYAPIEKHNFGPNFRPISPMIQISNGGGYADSVMTVKIPVHIPSDEFAMAYYYNENTETLEALPLFDQDSASITIGTMHFDPNTISGSAARPSGVPGIQNWKAWANVVVASVPWSILTSQPIFATGFKPGVDDWEFVNMGSYIAPNGICSGQSLTAMWYYYEKRLNGAATLFNQFDLVHTSKWVLWQDNRWGYRYASTVQADQNFTGWELKLLKRIRSPYISFWAFASAIVVTGEPQSVIMASTVSGAGHAMVVYAVAHRPENSTSPIPTTPATTRSPFRMRTRNSVHTSAK